MSTSEFGAAVELGGSAAAPPTIIPEAMATDLVAAWADLTNVIKGNQADAGSYRYAYADLGDLLDVARPILGKHGLALIQPVSRQGGPVVTIHTMLVHSSGHVMAWEYDVQMGQTAQQTGSAITYGRRYAAMGALGVATVGGDDDGQAAATAPPVESFENIAPGPEPVQTRRVFVLFDALGVTEKKDRLELTSAILDREVKSWNRVTRDEAVTVIEELQVRLAALEKARDDVGRLPDV